MFQPLTIITKSSTLDVAAALEFLISLWFQEKWLFGKTFEKILILNKDSGVQLVSYCRNDPSPQHFWEILEKVFKDSFAYHAIYYFLFYLVIWKQPSKKIAVTKFQKYDEKLLLLIIVDKHLWENLIVDNRS